MGVFYCEGEKALAHFFIHVTPHLNPLPRGEDLSSPQGLKKRCFAVRNLTIIAIPFVTFVILLCFARLREFSIAKVKKALAHFFYPRYSSPKSSPSGRGLTIATRAQKKVFRCAKLDNNCYSFFVPTVVLNCLLACGGGLRGYPLSLAVASRSRASASTLIGFFTVNPVDISICHLQVSQSQATKSGATRPIWSKSGFPMACDTS